MSDFIIYVLRMLFPAPHDRGDEVSSNPPRFREEIAVNARQDQIRKENTSEGPTFKLFPTFPKGE